jgi:hypothetical protein
VPFIGQRAPTRRTLRSGGYPARLRGEGRLPIEVCLPRVKTRPAAQIAEEIVGPVGMARSDPGRAGARGWVRDAGVALSRAWHVPCEVPARMTCVTRTRAAGSERT